MKRVLIALSVLLLLSIVLETKPVRADSFIIDFDGSNSGYEPVTGFGSLTGSGNPGSAWRGSNRNIGGGIPYLQSGRVKVPVSGLCAGAQVTITSVEMDAFASSGAEFAAAFAGITKLDGSSVQKSYRLDSKRNYWVDVSINVNLADVDYITFIVEELDRDAGDVPGMLAVMDNLQVNYTCAVTASFSTDVDNGTAPLRVQFFDHSRGATSWQWNFGDGSTPASNPNVTYTFTNPGTYTVTLTVSNGTDTDTATKVIYVTEDGGYQSAARYKPLTAADTNADWGMYDQQLDQEYAGLLGDVFGPGQGDPKPNVVFAWSKATGDEVHSVGPGTVTAITEARDDANCTSDLNYGQTVVGWGGGQLLGQCIIAVPRGIVSHGGGLPVQYFFRLDQNSMRWVTVEHAAGQTINYLVTDPMVSVGSAVEAGCIIGKTIAVYPLVGVELSSIAAAFGRIDELATYVSPTGSIDAGVTVLVPHLTDTDHPDEQRLLPLLALEPDSITPCNVDPEHSTCQRGANMLNPGDWELSPGVNWNQNYPPTLNPQASISQKNQLKVGQLYSFNVNVQMIMGPASVQIWLGTKIVPFTITQGVQTIQIEALVPTADQGLFTSWGILNTGTVAVTILDTCLSEGGAPQTPNMCVFANPSFDQGLGGWNASNDVTTDGTGQILVHDGSTLSQVLTLYPNGSQEYLYQVEILAVPAGTAWSGDASSTMGFHWEYPTGGDTDNFLAPDASTAWIVGNSNVPVTSKGIAFTATIPITQPTDGLFTIYVDLSELGSWHDGVWIRQICLKNPFDGFPGGGASLPYREICDTPSIPTGDSVGAWTFYLSATLDRFNYCMLMPQLIQMQQTISEIPTFLRWQMRYWQSVVIMFANWLGNQFIPWLGGHFRNMATGAGVTVVTSGTSTSLWDVLLAVVNGVLTPFVNTILGLVNQAADLLFGGIVQLISFAIGVFGSIIGYLGTAAGILTALAGSWNNATPTPIPYLPNCASDPQSSAFCILMWGMENTILSGPGAFFIPVVIGISAAHLLLWGAGKVRALALSVRNA